MGSGLIAYICFNFPICDGEGLPESMVDGTDTYTSASVYGCTIIYAVYITVCLDSVACHATTWCCPRCSGVTISIPDTKVQQCGASSPIMHAIAGIITKTRSNIQGLETIRLAGC